MKKVYFIAKRAHTHINIANFNLKFIKNVVYNIY